MYNKEFYPTPNNVIAQMLEPYISERYNGREYTVLKTPLLEPSAGHGNICDYLVENNQFRASEIFCIELDQDARFILQGKNYKVLGTDFLAYHEPLKFNSIVMNPPFSNGTTHLLKAWELLNDGGNLVCLLNAESVYNPYSKERQNVIELINQYGNYKALGNCFKDSERSTNVEVVCVWLKKPKQEKINYFENINFEKDYLEEGKYINNELSLSDPIKDLVSRYNGAVAILQERYKQQQILDAYLSDIDTASYLLQDRKDHDSLTQQVSFQDQLIALKARFWQTVFTKTKISKYVTSDFINRFESFQKQQIFVAFTEENIKELLSMFFLNRKEIMKECVLNVFEQCTRYHEKNIVHTEGWKTNKSYKLSKKIIIPYGVYLEKWGNFSYGYRYDSFYPDLDKALCYLNGLNIDNITPTRKSLNDLINAVNQGNRHYSETWEGQFFYLKIFKKGTLHLTFKDEKVLESINRFVGENSKQIGANY